MEKNSSKNASKNKGETVARYLGIDFGSKRVGVALSDETNTIAVPKAVIPNDRYLFTEIKNLVKGHKVSAIVMGDSVDFKGNPNSIMKEALLFKGEIERDLGLSVHLEPEFMTSQQAAREQGATALLDASAAAIILQSFLNGLKHKREADKK
jgi:putative Holliday junction resolvase